MLSGILTGLAKSLGSTVLVPIVEQELLSEAETLGEEEVQRLVTIPQSDLESIAVKGHDDVALLAARDKLASDIATGLQNIVTIARTPVAPAAPATPAS